MKKTYLSFPISHRINLILQYVICERKKKKKKLQYFFFQCLLCAMQFTCLNEFGAHKNSVEQIKRSSFSFFSFLMCKTFLGISKCQGRNSNPAIHVLFTICHLLSLGHQDNATRQCKAHISSVSLHFCITKTGSSQVTVSIRAIDGECPTS